MFKVSNYTINPTKTVVLCKHSKPFGLDLHVTAGDKASSDMSTFTRVEQILGRCSGAHFLSAAMLICGACAKMY